MPSFRNSHPFRVPTSALILIGLTARLLFDLPLIYLSLLFAMLAMIRILKVRRELISYPARIPANLMTGMRLLIVLSTPLFIKALSPLSLTFVFLLAAGADGLDGWLARRYNGSSEAGAEFDEETDAVFLLFLCLGLVEKGMTGAWITIPVFLREIWLLSKSIVHSNAEQVRFPLAKWIAGISFVVLPLCFILPQPWTGMTAIVVVCALSFSFVLEAFYFMWK